MSNPIGGVYTCLRLKCSSVQFSSRAVNQPLETPLSRGPRRCMPMEQFANVLAAGTTRFIAEHFIEPKLKLSLTSLRAATTHGLLCSGRKGIKRYRDPSVCLSRDAAACLGYRHTGCLQLSRRRTDSPCCAYCAGIVIKSSAEVRRRTDVENDPRCLSTAPMSLLL